MKTLFSLLAAGLTAFLLNAQSAQNSLHFDGANDYVSCALPTLFTDLSNNDFTFETWMKREASGRVFYAQADASNFATILLSAANALLYVKVGGITYSTNVPISTASEWMHIAATWDASEQQSRLYVNGVLQAGVSSGTSSSGTDNVMTIGSRTDGAQPFMGEMDETRIWNVVRTTCEIRSMMHSTPTGGEVNLIHHYNYNRGTAGGSNPTFTVLPDQAGLIGGMLNNFALTGATSNWVSSSAPVTGIGPQPAYTTTAAAAICAGESYSFGTQALTASGVYEELFVSVEGCDSLVTLTLTVHPVSSTMLIVSACSSYTWPVNNTTYTTGGVYSDTLQSVTGCDSIVSLNLSVLQPTAATQTISSCGDFTWLLNGHTYTASGLYTDTILNAAGCDSIVTLSLTVAQPTSSALAIEACESYTWPLSGQTYTSGGFYSDTIPNTAGCDSIITLALTMHSGVTVQETAASCGPYTWAANGMTYLFSGTYTTTLQTVHGCDSVIVLSLLVNSLPGANVTSNGDGTLSSGAPDATMWQWIDCSTGLSVPGANGDTFMPVQNGQYAVTALHGLSGCSDTSECFTVDFIGLEESQQIILNVWPNPSGDYVNITFAGGEGQLTVYDAQGKPLLSRSVVSGEQIALDMLQGGVYFFGVKNSSGHAVKRVVKE